MSVVFVGLVLAVTILSQFLLLEQVGQMAKTFAEVKASLDAIAAGVNSLEASIADLKDQVANGGAITQEQLDALGQEAADIVADIADTSDQGGSSGPGTPTLGASVDTNHFVTLDWGAVSNAVSYNVKRGTSSGAEAQIANVPQTTFQDTTTVAGQMYFYTVAAVAANGVSGKNSAEVSIIA